MMYMNVDKVQKYLAVVIGLNPVPEFIIDEEKSKLWGENVVDHDQIKKVMNEQDFREMQAKITSYLDTSKVITIC